MKVKLPDLGNERVILPLVAAMLALAYLYFTYAFRPSNPVAFPGVEDRMWTVLLILVIASVVLYAREMFGFLDAMFTGVFGHPVFKKLKVSAASAAGKLHPAARKHVASAMNRLPGMLSPLARALSRLSKIIAKIAENAAAAIACVLAYIGKYFERGKPYYFATLGFAAFLILSPLVIYKQSDLTETAVVIFIAYIALSYWKKLDDRVMIVTALLFLLSCPFLLIMKENARAELAAIYAYYSLCAGVFLQFVDYVQNREKYDREEAGEEAHEDDGRHGKIQEVEEGSWKITLPVGKK